MLAHISKVVVFVALVLSLTSVHALNPFIFNPSYTYELYSSADGSVQFIMLFTAVPVRAGETLVASNGSAEHVFVIPSSFPGSTSPITLIGTQSFADLKLVAPDFVVPDGFL